MGNRSSVDGMRGFAPLALFLALTACSAPPDYAIAITAPAGSAQTLFVEHRATDMLNDVEVILEFRDGSGNALSSESQALATWRPQTQVEFARPTRPAARLVVRIKPTSAPTILDSLVGPHIARFVVDRLPAPGSSREFTAEPET